MRLFFLLLGHLLTVLALDSHAFLDFVLEDDVVLLVDDLELALLHELLDLVLDRLVLHRGQDVTHPQLGADLLLQLLRYFLGQFLKDFQVGSLRDLCGDRRGYLAFLEGLLALGRPLLLVFLLLFQGFFVLAHGVLRQVLVEHLVVELVWIFLSHCVVNATTVRFNDVALSRLGCVFKSVLTLLNIGFHGLFVFKSGVLVLDKSPDRRLVALSPLLVVLVDRLVESLAVLVDPALVQLPKDALELVLKRLSFFLQVPVLEPAFPLDFGFFCGRHSAEVAVRRLGSAGLEALALEVVLEVNDEVRHWRLRFQLLVFGCRRLGRAETRVLAFFLLSNHELFACRLGYQVFFRHSVGF